MVKRKYPFCYCVMIHSYLNYNYQREKDKQFIVFISKLKIIPLCIEIPIPY